MNKDEYLLAISEQRKMQKALNDTYIWSKMAVLSLREMEKQKGNLEKNLSFAVPSKVPRGIVNLIYWNSAESLLLAFFLFLLMV